MAICGYNEAMGHGLREFFAGVFASLEEKAAREGVCLVEVCERELVEITKINAGLERSGHPTHAMFLGLNQMVFALIRDVVAEAPASEELPRRMQRAVEELVETLEQTELHADQLAEHGLSDPLARADALARWLHEGGHKVSSPEELVGGKTP